MQKNRLAAWPRKQTGSVEPTPQRKGPRERALEEGLSALSDFELVAMLLGTGTQNKPVGRVAAELLDEKNGIEGLMRVGPSELAHFPGIGLAKALRIIASLELGRRAIMRESRREVLSTADEVADHFSARLSGLEYEEMWVVALDGRNGIRAKRKVAQGGLHGCSVTARDILRAGLMMAASAIVLVHNHPSLDPTPSAEDIDMTRAVADGAEIVGMPLVDHVIVAGTEHVSFLSLGLLDSLFG